MVYGNHKQSVSVWSFVWGKRKEGERPSSHLTEERPDWGCFFVLFSKPSVFAIRHLTDEVQGQRQGACLLVLVLLHVTWNKSLNLSVPQVSYRFKKMRLEVPDLQGCFGGMRDVMVGHVGAYLDECRRVCPACTVAFLLCVSSSESPSWMAAGESQDKPLSSRDLEQGEPDTHVWKLNTSCSVLNAGWEKAQIRATTRAFKNNKMDAWEERWLETCTWWSWQSGRAPCQLLFWQRDQAPNFRLTHTPLAVSCTPPFTWGLRVPLISPDPWGD